MKNSRGEIGSFSFHTKGNELQVIPTLLATSCYPGGVVLERFYQQYFVTITGQSREWHYHCPQRNFSTCHPSRRLNSYKRSYGGKLIRKGKGRWNWVLKKKKIYYFHSHNGICPCVYFYLLSSDALWHSHILSYIAYSIRQQVWRNIVIDFF